MPDGLKNSIKRTCIHKNGCSFFVFLCQSIGYMKSNLLFNRLQSEEKRLSEEKIGYFAKYVRERSK